jgi:TfoX/Sxy family transcriptional regulator of competence genes
MKIKDEYKGKTIITYDSVLGQRRIEVDKIHPAQFKYYQTIGLGYIFESESVTISYKGLDEELQDDVNTEKEVIKKPVRQKPNATTSKRRKKRDVPS